jgi:hypothetical protein
MRDLHVQTRFFDQLPASRRRKSFVSMVKEPAGKSAFTHERLHSPFD